MNILCTISGFTAEARTLLEEAGNTTYAEPAQDKFAHIVSETEVLLVQLGLNVTQEVIDAAPHLKVIATATTGLDHIDTAYAESKGITVLSLKGETEFLDSITSTAELALGLMIALVRHIPAAHTSVLLGNWERETFRGNSLRGKRLGIIGYGRLGKMMARYGEALAMNVIYTDPHEPGGVSKEELLQQSDIVSLHIHLTPETEGYLDTEAFTMIKPGVCIVNTARGKIVDEDALLQALKDGTVGGYATDVLAGELAFETGGVKSPLIEYANKQRNVIITPHIGGTTTESREATDIFITKKLIAHL